MTTIRIGKNQTGPIKLTESLLSSSVWFFYMWIKNDRFVGGCIFIQSKLNFSIFFFLFSISFASTVSNFLNSSKPYPSCYPPPLIDVTAKPATPINLVGAATPVNLVAATSLAVSLLRNNPWPYLVFLRSSSHRRHSILSL